MGDPGSRGPRGTTLLEAMVVIAVLGVIAALAAPSLLPLLRKGRLQTETEAVAAFVDGVRRAARGEGRCYRVREAGGALLAERHDDGNCVNLDDASWTQTTAHLPDAVSTNVTVESLTATSTPADKFRLVFRPSGRLAGDADVDTSDDGARIVVSDPAEPSEARVVIVTAVGRVCALLTTNPPPPLTAPVRCP